MPLRPARVGRVGVIGAPGRQDRGRGEGRHARARRRSRRPRWWPPPSRRGEGSGAGSKLTPGCACSVVDLLPGRLFVVLFPVGSRHRDSPARPGPLRPGRGVPDPGPNVHAGCELHRRAQRGRGHPPVRRWVAGSNRKRDTGREVGAEPQRERVGRSGVADLQQRLSFVRRLRLPERDPGRIRGPQPTRLGATVTVPRGAGSCRNR